MQLIPNIPIPLDATPADYPRLVRQAMRGQGGSGATLVRRAIDARRKDDIHFVCTFRIGEDEPVLSLAPRAVRFDKPPIVVGAGPCGLFAALTLAEAGAKPILFERGQPLADRRVAVNDFLSTGRLQPESNTLYGEGGAGAFSDGKLNSGTKDPRARHVLETFVAHGAPPEILVDARPHIGTDRLGAVVTRMRERMIALGGTVHFNALVTELVIKNQQICGVVAGGVAYDSDHVILAVGHSARDTLAQIASQGVGLQAKSFSIGLRVEHPQALIDRAQYGRFAGHPALGAAEYRFAERTALGRGVYTFCMCPGGDVIPAANEPGGLCTNGMSLHARRGKNANAALLVDVTPQDYGDNPLDGFAFQRKWEQKAYELGGGGYIAPAQRMGDFLAAKKSLRFGSVIPTYRPGVSPADLSLCLPDFATQSLREVLPTFARRLNGFLIDDAVLTGVESRSSSPVRIPRDASGQSNLPGLYPAGEGAGYAGGILSAAVDGIKAAEAVMGR